MSMIYGGRKDGDHSGLSQQTQAGLIQLDRQSAQQPAPPPMEPVYKTGSDQSKVTNESGLRAALKKQGFSDAEVDRRVSQYKGQTGLR